MPDRIQIKEEAKQVLRGARVNPYLVSLIVVGVLGLLGGLDSYVGASQTVDQMAGYDPDLAAMLPSFPEFPVLLVAFVGAVNWLAQAILSAGWSIYHLGVRRGKEMPFSCLLDGFSFLGKLILLNIVMSIFVFLWSLLFYIPGLIAQYRYRFAVYNLCENPDIGIMEAINEQGPDSGLQVDAVCAGPFLHRVDPAVRPDSGHSGHLAGPLPGAGQRGLFPGDQAGEGHRLPVRPR